MNKFLIIILISLLTACSGSDENAQSSQQNAKKTESSQNLSKSNTSKSVIKVSGAENFTFKNEPKFSCRDDVIHIMTMTASPKFEMYLSSKAGKGTLELEDYDANRSDMYVDGKAVVAVSGNYVKGSGSAYGKFYFTNSNGHATINKIPTKAGDTFIAKVKASIQRSDGESINVDADLNIKTDGYMMQNCQL